MMLNNFKIAVRYLLRNKAFTGINLRGLILGFFSFLIVALDTTMS